MVLLFTIATVEASAVAVMPVTAAISVSAVSVTAMMPVMAVRMPAASRPYRMEQRRKEAARSKDAVQQPTAHLAPFPAFFSLIEPHLRRIIYKLVPRKSELHRRPDNKREQYFNNNNTDNN